MDRKIDIHKSAGILIKDRKFLITRSAGKDFFIAPGGKVEQGESTTEALKRELQEELCIDVNSDDVTEFGTFYALAAGHENSYLQMGVFMVSDWQGEIAPAAEVEEILWIDSSLSEGVELGSIFLHDVLPKLKEQD